MTTSIEPLLRTDQTAAILGIKLNTLDAWRCRGRGPKFVKWGRAIRYDRKDVLDWIESQKVASTSAYSA